MVKSGYFWGLGSNFLFKRQLNMYSYPRKNNFPDAYPDTYQYLEPDPFKNDRDSFWQFIFHSFDSGKACETAVQLHSFTEMSS